MKLTVHTTKIMDDIESWIVERVYTGKTGQIIYRAWGCNAKEAKKNATDLEVNANADESFEDENPLSKIPND